MGKIENGSGVKRFATVNADNELLVHSTATDMQSVSLKTGAAHVVYLKRNIATGGGGNEGIGCITYTGDKKMFITKIYCSTNGTSSNIEGFFSPFTVDPTGGDSYTPIHLNRGGSHPSHATVITGSSTITATPDDALEFFNARLSINGTSTFEYPIDGSIILHKNDSILIMGSSGTTGDKLRAQVWWFESDGD